MEKHKSEAARRVQRRVPGGDFDKIKSIRVCYDEEIVCSGEVLTWMMAMDASFILRIS
eukprot:Gb_41232 [translate_table: standard]